MPTEPSHEPPLAHVTCLTQSRQWSPAQWFISSITLSFPDGQTLELPISNEDYAKISSIVGWRAEEPAKTVSPEDQQRAATLAFSIKISR